MLIRTPVGNRRFPDFLLVGAAKAGTSTLYHHLRTHPQVFLPDAKEPGFFALAGNARAPEGLRREPYTVEDEDEYLELFARASPQQSSGDASTIYLYLHAATIANLRRLHPGWRDLRILMLLRDPTARAFSHYMNHIRGGYHDLSLEEAIDRCVSGDAPPLYDYVGYGRYAEQVRAYMESFEHVRVYLFEDLTSDPQALVDDACAFLGLPAAVDVDPDLRSNPSGVPRSRRLVSLVAGPSALKRAMKSLIPWKARARLRSWGLRHLLKRKTLEPQMERRLRDLFFDDIVELEALIGRDLDAWRGLEGR